LPNQWEEKQRVGLRDDREADEGRDRQCDTGGPEKMAKILMTDIPPLDEKDNQKETGQQPAKARTHHRPPGGKDSKG